MKYCLVLLLVLSGAGLAQICAPTTALQPNGQATGTLDASACTLPDGTWFNDYPVTFSTRGQWSASVAAADGTTPLTLTLRNAAGARIAFGTSVSGTSVSGTGTRRPLERGTYHIIVNAPAPGQGGAYTLTSSFSSAPNVLCRQFPMIGVIRSLNGTLGQGSCTLPDGSVYDGYQVTLYGTGTVDLAVNATGFTPLLILRTSDGYAVPGSSSVDANGAQHLTVPEVGGDTYTLIVAVSSPDQTGGAYSVTASFAADPDETCVSQGALTPSPQSASQQFNGAISPASCNFNLPNRDDSAPFNYYNIHLGGAGILQVTIDSADFSPLLLLLDADGNPLAEDIESGGSGTPLIRQQLPAGDYLLVLFNEDSFGGAYAFDYQYSPGVVPVCPVSSIASGGQANGILSGTNSCKDGAFLADVYQVVLPADGNVSLLVTSPDFSAFVDLHDASDNDLTWGTQSPDGSTSLLTADLPAGTYYVYAATMDMPGGYGFSYVFTPQALQPCPSPMAMLDNEYIQGAQLGPGSCQGPDGRLADYYTFSVPAASPLTEAIVMTSTAVAPDIALSQADGTPLRADENSYADGNAIIVQYLQPGNYRLKARSADPTAIGSYNLYFLFAPGGPPQLCAPINLPASGMVSGQTSFTSCAWYDNTFADVYQLTVSNSTQDVAISAQSSAFDAFLILIDSKGNILASNDNSGDGANSLLEQLLDPGVYYVVVKPATDPTSTGKYVITASAEPVSMIRGH